MTNSDKFSFISRILPSQRWLAWAMLVALVLHLVLPLTGCAAGGPQSSASTGYVLMPADRATVNALPAPRLSAVDLSGACRNAGPIFEDERARAKWTAPSYALPLGFWAMNYVGARAGTSAPPCTDIELATKLWQSAIGSPITGRLSERDVTEFVRIVDAHDPRYAQAGQRKMAQEKPEQRFTPKQAKSGDPKPLTELLVNAAIDGNLAEVQALIAKGADVNAKDAKDRFALMGASVNGHPKVVQALLAKGADVNEEYKGETALMMSTIVEGNFEVVKVLLAGGADVNDQNKEGITALMMASIKGNFEMVKLLLAGGADVNAKSNDGSTALSIASDSGHTQIVQLLKRAGAREHDEISRKLFCVIKCDNAESLCIVRTGMTAASKLLCKTKREACMSECLSAPSR